MGIFSRDHHVLRPQFLCAKIRAGSSNIFEVPLKSFDEDQCKPKFGGFCFDVDPAF